MNKRGMDVQQKILLLIILGILGFLLAFGLVFMILSPGAGQGLNMVLQKVGLHLGSVGLKGIQIGSGLKPVITSDSDVACPPNNKLRFDCLASEHSDEKIICKWKLNEDDATVIEGSYAQYTFEPGDSPKKDYVQLDIVSESGKVATASKAITVYPAMNCITRAVSDKTEPINLYIHTTWPVRYYFNIPMSVAESRVPPYKLQGVTLQVSPHAMCNNGRCETGEKISCMVDCANTNEDVPMIDDFKLCFDSNEDCVYAHKQIYGDTTLASDQLDTRFNYWLSQAQQLGLCGHTVGGIKYCKVNIWVNGEGVLSFKSVTVPWAPSVL